MFSTLLSDSYVFFRSHFYAIAGIILPIVIPLEVFAAVYQHLIVGEGFTAVNQLVLMAVGLVIYPLYAAGLVFYIVSALRGEPIDRGTAWRLGWANWGRYLLVTILVGSSIMFGLFLLVVPGIFLAARFAFSEFELLLRANDPINAIGRSWQLTREHMWLLAGGFVLITVALYTPVVLLESLLSPQGALYWVLSSVLNVLVSLFAAFYTIFAFRIYDLVKPQTGQRSADNTEIR